MFDLDHFVMLNDARCRAAGEALLRELGVFLRFYLRGEEVACRYGGEEFTITYPDASLGQTRHRSAQLSWMA